MAYTVTFWGTRGSTPTPGAHTARYGGNTPCVAVEGTGGGGDNGQGQLVILDAGTGIRALGRELVERQNGAVQAEILLSHAHWDHIQGLPHFKPFFAPGNAVRIWGSRQGTTSLEAILRQQMDPAVFPVPIDALSAKLTVRQVEPGGGEFTVGAFRVRAMRLRHPGTTLGYRLTPAGGGASMAYVTDNELGSGGHYDTPASRRNDFIAFLANTELLIHDAMYTPQELEQHRGWGHSTFEEAVTLAADAGVPRLVLFHHEPEHGDAEVDGMLAAARRAATGRGTPAEVLAAQEGTSGTSCRSCSTSRTWARRGRGDRGGWIPRPRRRSASWSGRGTSSRASLSIFTGISGSTPGSSTSRRARSSKSSRTGCSATTCST